jgi:hypothetical protein
MLLLFHEQQNISYVPASTCHLFILFLLCLIVGVYEFSSCAVVVLNQKGHPPLATCFWPVQAKRSLGPDPTCTVYTYVQQNSA